jgi:hypothetical protein
MRVDEAALMGCRDKVVEEHREMRAAERGEHHHPGQSRRETLLNEAQQYLYWATLMALTCRGDLEPTGEGPVPMPGPRLDLRGVDLLLPAVREVAEAVRRYNERFPDDNVDVREVLLVDLRQMAEKDYLAPYLREKLLDRRDD